jgi:hypothetical protein
MLAVGGGGSVADHLLRVKNKSDLVQPGCANAHVIDDKNAKPQEKNVSPLLPCSRLRHVGRRWDRVGRELAMVRWSLVVSSHGSRRAGKGGQRAPVEPDGVGQPAPHGERRDRIDRAHPPQIAAGGHAGASGDHPAVRAVIA